MSNLLLVLTWGIFWVMVLGTLMLVFLEIPKTEKLQNYKHARYLLSAIYLLMAVANIVQIIGGDDNEIWYSRIITLWIGCSMASSITIINITLFNLSFFSYKKFFKELIPSFVLTVISIAAYEIYSVNSFFFLFSYYAFLIYYIFVMVRFTFLLIKEFEKYKDRFDNYFAETEINHLSWIFRTQIIAISCGIMAFISLFLPLWFMCFFSLFLIFFYSYYAIRFINYPQKFTAFEPIVVETAVETGKSPISFSQLEEAVADWENTKKFVHSNINIENVAKELYTNRTYLSNYINTYKKKSFKQWICDLRINEAKQLLLSEPQVSVTDIAYRVGFSDKSNFTNRFSKNVGESPKKWREIYLNQN